MYSDLDLRFIQNPITKDIGTLTDSAAIENAIRNIVFFNTGESYFDFSFGGNLILYLFEPLNVFELDSIQTRLRNQLALNEPRVTNVSLNTLSTDPDANSMTLVITYQIVGFTQTYTFNTIIRKMR